MNITKSINPARRVGRSLMQPINGMISIALAVLVNLSTPQISNAMEYTLREYVADSDGVIMAEIVSKKAQRMPVRTRQYDGTISNENIIMTVYGVRVSKQHGSSALIKEFVLPGGDLEEHSVRWTHTPDFTIGMKILISLQYDELNQDYIPNGIPSIGRAGGAFIVEDVAGKMILIPYINYAGSSSTRNRIAEEDIKSKVDFHQDIIELTKSKAINFDSFWTAVMEDRNED